MTGWFPENVSTYGAALDGLIDLVFWIVGAWFLAALGTLLYFSLRFRHRDGAASTPGPPHSLRHLMFVLVPAAVVLGFDLMIDSVSSAVWEEIKIELPPADQVVRVQGEQFVWRFVHPGEDGVLDTDDDVATENHLHVPVNTVVHFELEAKDVLHSFFVPNLRLKQDAVPGRVITGWFEATREGTYQIVCAELCGVGHTNMRGWLHVYGPEDYRAWLAEEAEPVDSSS